MKTFFDTNILIYSLDNSDQRKHAIAVESFKRAMEEQTVFVSTQILSELFVNITRKVKRPLSKDDANKEIMKLVELTTILPVELENILKAIDIHKQYGFSFWDSLVVASAILADVERLLTEDLQDGQNIDGVLIVNPFRN